MILAKAAFFDFASDEETTKAVVREMLKASTGTKHGHGREMRAAVLEIVRDPSIVRRFGCSDSDLWLPTDARHPVKTVHQLGVQRPKTGS